MRRNATHNYPATYSHIVQIEKWSKINTVERDRGTHHQWNYHTTTSDGGNFCFTSMQLFVWFTISDGLKDICITCKYGILLFVCVCVCVRVSECRAWVWVGSAGTAVTKNIANLFSSLSYFIYSLVQSSHMSDRILYKKWCHMILFAYERKISQMVLKTVIE